MRPAHMVFPLAAAALLLAGLAQSDAPATFEVAKTQAEAQGKLLLLDFFTET